MSQARTPARVGPWILGRKLGAGAFGAVFEAVHSAHPDVRRALKWIPTPDAEVRSRFVREAELLARVQHPGIVRVHEAGQIPEGVYLVLELVSGRSLRALVEDSPGGLPLERACSLAIEIGRAVGAAHALGVAHRDLKPENVLVEESGTPRVIDFGLALAADAERLTVTGARLGTVGYMAPEQIDGRRADQGPPTDVFALGVIFYELLTGERPYSGTELQIVTNMARGRFEPPTRKRPDLPAWTDEVVARALASRPRQRPPDGEAFARAIEAGLSGALTSEKRARRVRRLVVVGTILAVTGTVGGLLFARSEARRRALVATTDLEHEATSLDLRRWDADGLAKLTRERAELPASALDSEECRRVDAALALVEHRVRLRAPDDTAAVAAFELVSDEALAQALRAREGGTDVRDEAVRILVNAAGADPSGWGRKVEALHRTPELAPGLAHLRVGQARAAKKSTDQVTLLRRAWDTDATTFDSLFEAWSHEPLPPDGSLDATLELGRAMLHATPQAASHGAVQRRVVALRLRRCELRRKVDPAGALEDRKAAATLDPVSPSPLWYEGLVHRLVLRGSAPDATAAELATLRPALIEMVAEDAAWGIRILDVQRIIRCFDVVPELVELAKTDDGRIVIGWLQRCLRDHADLEPLRDPLSAGHPTERLAAAADALERVSWRTLTKDAGGETIPRASEVQARAPSTTWAPEAVSAALAAHGVPPELMSKVASHKESLHWLDTAFEREIARSAATRRHLEASGADEDVRHSLDIELMRAAALRAAKGMLAFEGLSPGSHDERLERCREECFKPVREAIDVNPDGNASAFGIKILLVQLMSDPPLGIGDPDGLVGKGGVRDLMESDPTWIQTVADPSSGEVSWQTDIARASYWFADAYLELVPPQLDEAETVRRHGRFFADREFDLAARDELLEHDAAITKRIEELRHR